MMDRRRSPLHLARRQPFGPKGPTFHIWTCDAARFRSALFQSRRHRAQTAIIHPSTKGAKWQVSYFEDNIPTGDFQASNCADAIREFSRKSWRLVEVNGLRSRRR